MYPQTYQGRKVPSWETGPRSVCVCKVHGPHHHCHSEHVHPHAPRGMAAPRPGVGKPASVLMPGTATQEEKCPGVIEINYPAPNPVKDPTCQLK